MRGRVRIAFAIAIGVLALASAWSALESSLRVDRHRPFAERELERLLGLPVSISRLELQLLPTPRLSALGTAIGEGELRLEAWRIDLVPRVAALLARRVELREVAIDGVSILIPDDPGRLREAWKEISENLERALADGPPAPALHVERIELHDVALARASGAGGIVAGDLWAEVDPAAIEVGGTLEIPDLAASLDGRLRVGADGPAPWHGELRLRGLRTGLLGDLPQSLHASLDGELQFEGDPERLVHVHFRAEPTPLGAIGPSAELRGRMALEAGARRAAFEIDAPGLDAAGSVELPESAAPRLRIATLGLRGAALRALLDAIERVLPGLGVAAGEGVVEARDWSIALAHADRPAHLESGSLAAQGLLPSWQGHALAEPWELDARVEDGGLRFEALAGPARRIEGTLAAAAAGEGVALSLAARVALDPELLGLLGVADTLADATGVLEIEELRTRLPVDASQASFRAHLRQGALRWSGTLFDDTLEALELHATGAGERIEVEGRARSKRLGDLHLTGVREPGTRALRGVLALDAAEIARNLDGELREMVGPLLRTYGKSRFGFEIDPADEAGREWWLRLERDEKPRGRAALALHLDPETDTLGDVSLDLETPASTLRFALPEALNARGTGRLRLERSAREARFALTLDATALALRLGALLDKAAGEDLSLNVRGRADAEGWTASELEVAAGSAERVRLVTEGERWRTRDLRLDLGAWSFLLPGAARAGGRVEGSMATHPIEAELRLVGATLSPARDLEPLRADGRLEIGREAWRARGLRIRSERSDLEIAGEWRGATLSGRVAGASLDADLLRDWVDAWQALRPAEAAPARDADAGNPPSAEVEIALDRVWAGRSETRNVRATLRAERGNLHFAPIALETYEGRVSGSLDWLARERVQTSLDIAGVTGRFLDDLVFADEPRDIRGSFDGTLRFEAPSDGGLRAMLAAGDGTLHWSASNGSFGRLGLATKLVTVLRAGEALRLKLPSIRDEGLVFDRVEASFAMQRGRLEITQFRLDSKVYALSASGDVDFAAERSHVPIEFNAIRGLTAILEPIPIAGDALRIANVRLLATGSPYDMKIGVASFRDQIVGASMALPGATVSRVRDALELLRKAGKRAPGLSGQEPGAAPDAASGALPPESEH